MGSVFEPASQHADVDAKIVASLERLGRVFRLLLQDAAQERGLSPLQANILVHLLYHESHLRRVGRLAGEFGMRAATISDAVASLEEKGLLSREACPEDGRVATLALTAAGERVAEELSGWAEEVKEHLGSLEPGEKEVVMRSLMDLIASLQKADVIGLSRMCVTCRFFRPGTHPGSTSPHHCALLDAPLAGSDLRVDCPEHEPVASA